MNANPAISATVFAAHLQCPTKAYLLTHGGGPPSSFFTYTLGRTSSAFKAAARERLGADVIGFEMVGRSSLVEETAAASARVFVDCEAASYIVSTPTCTQLDCKTRRNERPPDYVPIVFSAWNKTDRIQDLQVCFGALALQQATGGQTPTGGIVVHGERQCIKTIRIADHLSETRRVIKAIKPRPI